MGFVDGGEALLDCTSIPSFGFWALAVQQVAFQEFDLCGIYRRDGGFENP